MAPTRQVSHRQLELLVEFAEGNKEIVLNHIRKGPLGFQSANRAWAELASRLNSIGDGVTKSPTYWKRYWHLLKCRTKGKAADIRRSDGGTGGGPNRRPPLTDLELKIISIIGKPASVSRDPIAASSLAEASGTSQASQESQRTRPRLMSRDPNTASSLAEASGTSQASQESQRTRPRLMSRDPIAASSSAEASGTSQAFHESQRTRPRLMSRDPIAASSSDEASDTSQTSQESLRTRPRRNRDENLPGWAYDLEERRIAVEERMVQEIAGLGATNRAILGCLQQLVQLLQEHNSNC